MTKADMHGYSGKPLYLKLGLMPGMRCLVINGPANYLQLVDGVSHVRISNRLRGADVVHLFCPTRRVLEQRVQPALERVADPGALWVSWPKKTSPLYKDLTEGMLREVILPTGWVDVKVCAVDAHWSGLKFVRRRR
ncbi:MAG: DUF3052 domain-containing protein [Pseudomonadota bacterium]